ncbi:SAS complex subunit [Gnomoniopsis smithogilvyi]|uniref:histone acetyltransferase n=1 Tax=Gnomoniopsis smithogilvyi TaxID=1191159 RepID=A0A9W8YLT4_9PEZI|nr:SAS complex subunit [Gnomoniopsis smithogilvyi]
MPSFKRKRPHDTAVTAPRAAGGTSPPQLKTTSKSASTVTRRATRQTSDADPPPIPWAADPEPRRRRKSFVVQEQPLDNRLVQDDHEEQKPDVLVKQVTGSRNHSGQSGTVSVPAAATGKRGRPPIAPEKHHRPVLRTTNQADPALVPKPVIRNRLLRHSRHDHAHSRDEDPRNGDKNDPVAPIRFEAPSAPLRRRASTVGPSQPFPKPTRNLHQSAVPSSIAPMMTQPQPRSAKTSDHVAANSSKPVLPTVTISNATQSPPRHAKKQAPAKQNSDQRRPGIIDRNIDKVVFGNVCFSTWYHSPYDGGNKEEALANPNRKTKEERLDRLYVCPCCFKYSKELVPWWQHVHQCERRGYVPGRKIYTHPQGQARSIPTNGAAPTTAVTKGAGRKRKASDATPYAFEEEAEYQGEWSIWEVDGEEDGLFCQNLSLFAKLFLDNKSVFFDVVGFKYFLLVHTTPRPPSEDDTTLPPKRQVVGFFSKEKLSWDNNNLACILVFPPWQRKGLGALLMGVSYEISRREGMLGGPEKPISDLGKKGYKRFWAGEVASWLLGLDTSGDDEVLVDVEECSKATWIVPEDCLMVLREMGMVEEAEAGPPKKKRATVTPAEATEEAGDATVQEDVEAEVQIVPRVQLSKEAVWAWVRAHKIPLEAACDPDGFVDGYAIKQTGIEEDEEE